MVDSNGDPPWSISKNRIYKLYYKLYKSPKVIEVILHHTLPICILDLFLAQTKPGERSHRFLGHGHDGKKHASLRLIRCPVPKDPPVQPVLINHAW